MTKRKSVITTKKLGMDENPTGVERQVLLHTEREKAGKYIMVPGIKPPTMIFVREGRDEKALIERYIKRRETKQVFKR